MTTDPHFPECRHGLPATSCSECFPIPADDREAFAPLTPGATVHVTPPGGAGLEELRGPFEKWLETMNPMVAPRTRGWKGGPYVSPRTEIAWQAFQAGARLR